MEILLPFVPLLALVALWPLFGNYRTREEARRLAALERKLQLVMDHLGIVEPEPALPAVSRQIEAGNKIQAIKAYRKATGVGLKEAKEAVERMAGQRLG